MELDIYIIGCLLGVLEAKRSCTRLEALGSVTCGVIGVQYYGVPYRDETCPVLLDFRCWSSSEQFMI